MFGKNKKKEKERIIPATERTPDSRPFFIPKITEHEDKTMLKRRFVSPVFGKSVKDEVVLPANHRQEGDIDKRYDPFRRKPKLTKEEAKRRYGHEFYEFMSVTNADKQKMIRGELDASDLVKRRQVEPVAETPVVEPQKKAEPVSIDAFFNAVTQKEPEFVTTLDDLTRELEHQEEDLDLDQIHIVDEDEDEPELPLFTPNQPRQEQNKTLPRAEEDVLVKKTEPQPPKVYSAVGSDYGDYFLPPVSLMKKSPVKKESSEDWIKATSTSSIKRSSPSTSAAKCRPSPKVRPSRAMKSPCPPAFKLRKSLRSPTTSK
jgi:DNA segregation ATPase FtsK/SpoIIIE, S-DNA-T family